MLALPDTTRCATSWNSPAMREPKRYPVPPMTMRMTRPEMTNANGSGAESQRMKGCAPSRTNMARMIAPNAMRMTPDRYQITTGMTATATTMSVRFRNSTWLIGTLGSNVENGRLYAPLRPADRASSWILRPQAANALSNEKHSVHIEPAPKRMIDRPVTMLTT